MYPSFAWDMNQTFTFHHSFWLDGMSFNSVSIRYFHFHFVSSGNLCSILWQTISDTISTLADKTPWYGHMLALLKINPLT